MKAATVMGNNKKSLLQWKLVVFGGLLTSASAFLLAAVLQRGTAFATSVTSSPIGFMAELFSFMPASYAQACDGDTCHKYCCTDVVYPDIKWKDCDRFCTSFDGHFGQEHGRRVRGRPVPGRLLLHPDQLDRLRLLFSERVQPRSKVGRDHMHMLRGQPRELLVRLRRAVRQRGSVRVVHALDHLCRGRRVQVHGDAIGRGQPESYKHGARMNEK